MNNEFFTGLSEIRLALSKIYLDPNNPRFVAGGKPPIEDKDIDDENIQEDTMRRMLQGPYAIGPLKDSIQANGFLYIDRIVVRRFKTDKYVVLEGNRRITAAKDLLAQHEKKAITLDKSILDTFNHIDVLLYSGEDPNAAWLFQGIRHISGIRDWPAINKADLLVRQLNNNPGMSFSDAGRIFGLSSIAAGQYVRAFYAFEQAKNLPAYDDVVDENLFPFLQELFGRSNFALRNWLGWNDDEKRFTNSQNFELFMNWMYPLNEETEEDVEPDVSSWELRRVPRAIDLREVSKLIANHKDRFDDFLNGLDLGAINVELEETSNGKTNYYLDHLSRFEKQVRRWPVFELRQTAYKEQLLKAIEETIELMSNIHDSIK